MPSGGFVAAVVAAAALFGTPARADAAAASRAACTMQVHIQLTEALVSTPTAGSFHATQLGRLDCAGTLDGALSDGAGWIDVRGSYQSGRSNPFGRPVAGLGTCSIASSRVSFLAATPRVLSNRRFIRFSGTVRLTPTAGRLLASGTGRAGTISPISPGSEPVRYTAVGGFQPDRGQTCARTGVRSGTLTERFVITGAAQ
jgi:hypothetical protein